MRLGSEQYAHLAYAGLRHRPWAPEIADHGDLHSDDGYAIDVASSNRVLTVAHNTRVSPSQRSERLCRLLSSSSLSTGSNIYRPVQTRLASALVLPALGNMLRIRGGCLHGFLPAQTKDSVAGHQPHVEIIGTPACCQHVSMVETPA